MSIVMEASSLGLRIALVTAVVAAALSACSQAPGDSDPPGNAPSVSLLQPTHGSRHTAGALLPIEASATDTDGRIVSVNAHVANLDIELAPEADGSSRYLGNVRIDQPGPHEVTVSAVDERRQAAEDSVSIEIVAEEPEIRLEPPVLTLRPLEATTVTAQVSGIDEEDLRWATDGGTVEGAGASIRFTAPARAGRYTLTVSSREDAAVFAEAQVTVELAPFSIVVLPDTQNMIKVPTNLMVDRMTDWIVEQADVLDIAFVTHVGDVVDQAADVDEWERADAALSDLDGHLPYSVALGDHEYEIEENMATSTDNYEAFFGPHRYQGEAWYLGASPNGRSHAQTIVAGGIPLLHIALEWEGGRATDPDNGLAWARTVLEDNPGVPTIITTHAYVWDLEGQEGHATDREGYEIVDGSRRLIGSSGRTIFETLVEPFPQVFMVLNGHYHSRSGASDGEYRQVSRNSAGTDVYEMLSDYQDGPNGGDGWLRVLSFVPGGGVDGLDRIDVNTYSPVLDEYQTDASSDFHFDLEFEERFGLP